MSFFNYLNPWYWFYSTEEITHPPKNKTETLEEPPVVIGLKKDICKQKKRLSKIDLKEIEKEREERLKVEDEGFLISQKLVEWKKGLKPVINNPKKDFRSPVHKELENLFDGCGLDTSLVLSKINSSAD